MKKRGLVKKSLIPALGAVLVYLVALTAVSYAWFTTGKKVNVGNLTVNVAAADGLQISVNAQDWKSSVSQMELIKANWSGVCNQFPSGDNKIQPVSSAGNYNNGKQEMFLGEVDKVDSTKLSATASVEEAGITGNFIAFDVFFKTDAEKILYLDSNSDVTGTNNAHKSARVSFALLGTSTDSIAAEVQGKTDAPGKNFFLWEPNDNDHITGILGDDLPYYAINRIIPEDQKQTLGNCSTEYFTLMKGVGGKAKVIDMGTEGTTTPTELLTLGKGANKVRIYIWIEGQDADCTNEISLGSLNTVLKFTTEAPVEQ